MYKIPEVEWDSYLVAVEEWNEMDIETCRCQSAILFDSSGHNRDVFKALQQGRLSVSLQAGLFISVVVIRQRHHA